MSEGKQKKEHGHTVEKGQHQHKPWTKKHLGNLIFANVKNPLRNYIEQELPATPISKDRPQKLVDLSIGDPTTSLEFRTHKDNLQTIADNVGRVDGYTNLQGLDQTREAIACKFASPNYKISKDNVFMTAGGSLAMWATIYLLAQKGDNFLFPSPGFPLLLTIAKSMQIEPRFYKLKANDKWKADIHEMEKLIDDRTKFIYVNDPSNPLGSCWSQEHKKEIIDLARRRNLPIMSDQIYEGVTYDQPVKTFAEYATDDVTIFKCSGLTKRWLGPGWRLGWLIVYAKEELAVKYNAYLKGIFNILLMPHTVMQCAVKEIIKNPHNDQHMQSCLAIMRENKKILSKELEGQTYCKPGDASGALYATIILDLEQFDSTKIKSTIDFSKYLFAEENVMIFPGIFFASEVSFIRLVISCSTEKIVEFVFRFKRFCRKNLKKIE